jgi:hypothetical protein
MRKSQTDRRGPPPPPELQRGLRQLVDLLTACDDAARRQSVDDALAPQGA